MGYTSGQGVMDFGVNGASGGWIQVANNTNLAVNYSLLLNPNGGNVGIGTTTPSEELTVDGTIQATNLLGGAVNLTTDASGNIIRDPSDVRLKENIEPLQDSLAKLLELQGVSYEWKDKERFGEQKEIGFLAQDVDLVLPEVVRKGGEYWSLNTRNIVAVVVEAVKELYERVEEYFARTEQLELENAELEARVRTLEEILDVDTPELQSEPAPQEEVPLIDEESADPVSSTEEEEMPPTTEELVEEPAEESVEPEPETSAEEETAPESEPAVEESEAEPEEPIIETTPE
jgi:hypothetical protein